MSAGSPDPGIANASDFRDQAAGQFERHTGLTWRPRSGSRVGHRTPTSAKIASRGFLAICLAQDLAGLRKLPVLAHQRLEPGVHVSGRRRHPRSGAHKCKCFFSGCELLNCRCGNRCNCAVQDHAAASQLCCFIFLRSRLLTGLYQPPKILTPAVIASEAKQPGLARFADAVCAHIGVRSKDWVASLRSQ